MPRSAIAAERSAWLGGLVSSGSSNVRVSSLMPVRRIVLTKADRPSAGYIERLFYNALAANLRQGRITVSLNSRILTLPEAERLVRKARQNGWICDRPVQLPTS